MDAMWKLVFLILCTNYFTLGLHIRRRSSDYDNEVGLNQQCENDNDCIIEHSYCNDDNFPSVCICKENFQEKDDECVEKPEIGSKCENDETCSSIVNSHCAEECACKDGYIASPDKKSCLKIATEANGECEIQEQCKSIPDSTCKDKKCVVPKEIGEDCTETSDCRADRNLECREEKCECLENHVEDEKTCLKKAENIGDSCTVDGQCTSISAICKENKCEALTTIPAPSPPTIENSCSESTNCTDENMTCVENSCKCKEGFVGSDITKGCLKEAEKLGDECTEDVQCSKLNNVTCVQNVCAEKTSQRLMQSGVADSRTTIIKIGGSCVKDSDCGHMENSVCKEDVCQCTEEYVPSIDDNKCLKIGRNEGDSCEIDKQCETIGEASCSDNKCVKAPLRGEILDDSNRDSSATSLKMTGVISSILIIGIVQLL